MSSSIQLFGHPQSGPCRSVSLTLDVLGIKYDYKFVNVPAGEARKPDYIKMNIQHNVPYLLDGDFGLNESQAIMVYLMEKYGSGKSFLFPSAAEDIKTRSRINQRLCFNCQVFWDILFQTCKPVVFAGAKSFEPAKLDRLKEVLGFMQHFLRDTGFIAGTEKMSLADLSFLATYTTMEVTGDNLVKLSDFPEVVAWAERMKGLIPNYEEANGKGAKVFEEFFRARTGLI